MFLEKWNGCDISNGDYSCIQNFLLSYLLYGVYSIAVLSIIGLGITVVLFRNGQIEQEIKNKFIYIFSALLLASSITSMANYLL